MHDWKREILRRLAPLKLAPAREAEIAEELAQHLSDLYQELVAHGEPEDVALRSTLDELEGEDWLARRLSAVTPGSEREPVARGHVSGNLFSGLARDVRFSCRGWVRNPAFFLFAVGILALGIGGTTAIFSVAYNILLRPLPYRDAGRLVYVWEDAAAFGFPRDTPAPGNYASWKAQTRVFAGMAAMDEETLTLTGKGAPQQLTGIGVTADMFPMLGVNPVLGRGILPREDTPASNRVVILSHALWMTNFGGDPRIIGGTIALNNANYTVIGVMPAGFIFPDRETQLWTPMGLSAQDLANHDSHYLHVLGRLKPGVSLRSANADLALVAARLQQEFPRTNTKIGALAEPMRAKLEGSSQDAALVLLGAAGFVLLIACANLANLLLARAAGRQRELAMRMALGASRRRIARQLLTESLLLSVLAAGMGLLLAGSATPGLASLVPSGLAPITGAGVNVAVLAFLVAISIFCGSLFGLAPALRLSRLDLANAMKHGGARSGAGRGATRTRDLLAVAEFALALVLVSGATLMLRSFINLRGTDPGFRPAHVLALETELPFPKYKDVARRNAFFEQVLARVNHLPGVVAAGCTTWLPLTNWGGAGGITIEDRSPGDPSHVIIPNLRMISDRYLQAMGVRLIAGRAFNAGDGAGAQLVALVNQTAARELWPGRNPIGTRFNRDSKPPDHWITVVGVVGDVRQAGLDQPPRPEIYFPFQQTDYFAPGYLAVRTAGDPMSLANALRRQVWAVDKQQPVTGVMPLETMLEDDLAPRRLQSSLLGGFAGFALLLAALGIYAVLAFSVAQRTQEIGVRLALGARPSHILGRMFAQGIRLAAAGVALGLAGGLALSRLFSDLLFGVSAADPLTFVGAVALLLAVAAAACLIPAWRATRIDPIAALRCD